MIPKEAIEKAIEGGWSDIKPHLIRYVAKRGIRLLSERGYAQTDFSFEQIALDPTFWQALGRALKWKETYTHGSPVRGDEEGCTHSCCQDWYQNAMKMLHLNFEGDEVGITQFWSDLLGNKE